MQIDDEELAILLMDAFWYNLGRMTYSVGECVKSLIKYWKVIPPHWRKLIHSEIIVAIERNEAGMDMDVAEWRKVLALSVEPILKHQGDRE